MKTILTIAMILMAATCMASEAPVGVTAGAFFGEITEMAYSIESAKSWSFSNGMGVKAEAGMLFAEDNAIARAFAVWQKPILFGHVGLGTGTWHYIQTGDDMTAPAYKIEVGATPLGIELAGFGELVPTKNHYYAGLSLAFKF